MRQPILSLFHKLFFWFVGISTATVFLFGYIHTIDSRGNIESDIRIQAISSLSMAIAYFGQSYLIPIQGTETLLAGTSKLDDMLRASGDMADLLKPDIERQFMKFAGIHPGIFLSIRFFDKDGMEMVSASQNMRLKNKHNLNRSPARDIFYQKAEDVFKRLKTEGKKDLLFTEPFAYQNGRQTLIAGVVKQDPDTGGFHGAFLMHVDLTGYLEYLSNTMVFGKKFLLSASHDGQSIMVHDSGLHDPSSRVGNDESIVITDHVLLGARGTPLLDVTVKIPSDAFFKLIQDDLGPLVMAGSISLILITIVSLFVSRLLTRPIVALRKAMADVGNGKLDVFIAVESRDEIGQLAGEFNKMIRHIHYQNKIMEKSGQGR
ncbi:MAG: HAMP domain-containing protein [Magnetococcus sp. MYC-9]